MRVQDDCHLPLLRRLVPGGRSPLKDALGALELGTARGAQPATATVEKVLNHPDTRTNAFGRHVFARHRSRNLSG